MPRGLLRGGTVWYAFDRIAARRDTDEEEDGRTAWFRKAGFGVRVSFYLGSLRLA